MRTENFRRLCLSIGSCWIDFRTRWRSDVEFYRMRLPAYGTHRYGTETKQILFRIIVREADEVATVWDPSNGRSISYLVDPASSHMLVSKIKPCMSKHKPLHGEAANGSLGHPWFIRSYNPTWITVVILELIHASKLRPLGERARLLDQNQSGLRIRTFGDSG
jgi:hypothetical protein